MIGKKYNVSSLVFGCLRSTCVEDTIRYSSVFCRPFRQTLFGNISNAGIASWVCKSGLQFPQKNVKIEMLNNLLHRYGCTYTYLWAPITKYYQFNTLTNSEQPNTYTQAFSSYSHHFQASGSHLSLAMSSRRYSNMN